MMKTAEQAPAPSGEKLCRECGSVKPTTAFASNPETRDRLLNVCRACAKRYNAERGKSYRRFVDSVKVTAGCADCGYDAHPEALDFDHLPGQEKGFALAAGPRKPMHLVVAEIEKCEVVCANCHRIRTANRRNACPIR